MSDMSLLLLKEHGWGKRVSACVCETQCIYADSQNGSYFPWSLPTAPTSSFSDIDFNSDIHFRVTIQNRSSVKNVFKNNKYVK